MKKLNLITCLILISFTLFPQQKIKLWNEKNATKKEKWSELTVFLPEKPDTSGISVIICPGGSYIWLDMDNEGFSVAKYLNNHGIAAFVLKYRTALCGNHYPAMIEDLERAIQIVKENSKEYGINPEKVGVMGFSAGGHLAGTAAIYSGTGLLDTRLIDARLLDVSLRPYFVAMIYPVVSMEDSICHKKSRRNLLGKNRSDELKQMMSLEKNVRSDMPPVFLLHCIGDKTVDYRNSVLFDKALTEKNVKHKFLLLDEYGHGGHGFGIQPNGKATGWMDEFLKWTKTLIYVPGNRI